MSDVAKNVTDSNVRRAMVKNLTDQALLSSIVKNG